MLLAIVIHIWGTRSNKRKAKRWMAVHAPLLDSEFALVGYVNTPKKPESDQIQADGLLKASAALSGENLPADLLKEKTASDFQTYATGRQNTAFLDMKLQLYKRYNPIILGGEYVASLLFESFSTPAERFEAVAYAFDGKEKDFVPPSGPGSEEYDFVPDRGNSSYDGFVFAVVNKNTMRRLRDERYDISLSPAKDNAKLPNWAICMSESAEITDTLLTKELITAIEFAGDSLEYLIVTDQPVDKPTTLNETIPRKRLHLSLRVPSDGWSSTLPLFAYFLRMPDTLVAQAHFRPEVMRKVTATREVEIKKLKKVSDEEAEEERRKVMEKSKKDERDRRLKGMSAEEQKKFLEKEKAREQKRSEKKMARKG